jgi:glycosyltransferase involved in cell wall biosynthesis
MRIVVDGLGAEPGTSASVILEHLVSGWASLGTDTLHVLVHPQSRLSSRAGVDVIPARFGRFAAVSRIRAQTFLIPRMCRRLRADGLVGLLPSTSIAPLPCPRVIIALDLRYELLPHQFHATTRIVRKVAYWVGWHQADGIGCISERTRQDLLRPRPWLRNRRVAVTPLGSDHVASWRTSPGDHPYAVAFGQFGNKNAAMVIDGWAVLRDRGPVMPLRLIGMPDEARQAADAQIAAHGLGDLVTPVGWLYEEDLRQCFAGAALFVFPSNFEGFGLPAVEAMRLRVPLVIGPEPALLEVTQDTATVMDEWTARSLADAVDRALTPSSSALDAAEARASEFTWAGMASGLRALLTDAIAGRPPEPVETPSGYA